MFSEKTMTADRQKLSDPLRWAKMWKSSCLPLSYNLDQQFKKLVIWMPQFPTFVTELKIFWWTDSAYLKCPLSWGGGIITENNKLNFHYLNIAIRRLTNRIFVNMRYTAPRSGTNAFCSGHLSTPPAGRQILSFVVQPEGWSPWKKIV